MFISYPRLPHWVKSPKRTTGRADGVQCRVERTSPYSPVAFAGWSLPTASCPTRASTTYEKRPCRLSDAVVLQGCCVSLAWQESRAFTALWYQTWWHPSGRYHGQRRRSCVLTANVDRDKLKRRINAFSCVHRNCRAMWTRTAQCRAVADVELSSTLSISCFSCAKRWWRGPVVLASLLVMWKWSRRSAARSSSRE